MPFDVSCADCGQAYPPEGFPYRCPHCGGLYDLLSSLIFDPAQVDCSQPGIWCYRHTFGLPDEVEAVSLGEGNTPLVWAETFGRRVAFKCEFLNPTGSFKDRGSAVIAAWLRSRGIHEVVEDSSGNAGASLAAYASRAGINAQIFVPTSASGPKRMQIEAYGAALTLVPGTRTDVAEAVKKTADTGASYASHAYLPFNIPGYATAAYEIFAQLGNKMPGAVIVPAGQGGLLLSLSRGFSALRIAKLIWSSPKLIGVQARACAPLWVMLKAGAEGSGYVPDSCTQADGVRVRFPLRGGAVVTAVKESGGTIVVVDEEDILPGRDALALLGFYVEPTSAIVWTALVQNIQDLTDPVVVVLTGSGLKSA